jgi:hypothetical protein
VTASLWAPIFDTLLIFVAFMAIGTVVMGFLLWRYGRRKWRAFHNHGAVIGAKAVWNATSSARVGPRGPIEAERVDEWSSRQVRKELWRAVDQAEAAVRTADGLGGPTASLPSLCRRLHEAAIGLDQVLRVEPSGAVPAAIAAQAKEVMRAAEDVQAAAVASASDATGQRVADLTHDAEEEIRLLDAGLASARRVLPPPRR